MMVCSDGMHVTNHENDGDRPVIQNEGIYKSPKTVKRTYGMKTRIKEKKK